MNNITMINSIKTIIGKGILFFMVLMMPLGVYANTILEKGTYTISNEVSHDNPVGAGMARSYTEEVSVVEVNDKGIFVSLGFNNTQFMGDFVIKVNGSPLSYEVAKHDTTNNLKELKFKIPSLEEKITVGLYVIPMDVTVEYEVSFQESSLKLVKKVEESVQKQETVVTEPTAPVQKTEPVVEIPKVEREETKAVTNTTPAQEKKEEQKPKEETKKEEQSLQENIEVEDSELLQTEEVVKETIEESVEETAPDEIEKEEIEEVIGEVEVITQEKSNAMVYVVGGVILILAAVAVIIIKKNKGE